MRTFCLNLQKQQEPSCAEVFVALSPRVQFRAPHFVFIDIESTSGLFGGESRLLDEGLRRARLIEPTATGGIADHPATAQVLSLYFPQSLSLPGDDRKRIENFPLHTLTAFEGLQTWERRRQVDHIVDFLRELGFETLGDIMSFSVESFRERWGETGSLLWRRLHGLDEQIIDVLIPQETLNHYLYFEHPLHLTGFLAQPLKQALEIVFMRLHGRGRFAKSLELILHCEYSDHRHNLKVEPVAPGRDQNLFENLIFQRLEKISFENPIRQIEITVYDIPEKTLQLDFFEPRDTQVDRWQRLISRAKQAEVEIGFLEPINRHFPEESYKLKADWPELLKTDDKIEKWEDAIRIRSVYAKNLQHSPRPSLLLESPTALSTQDMSRFRKLSFFPTERIESSWWIKNAVDRDYYYALTNQGELTWIFQNRQTRQYFLHGYFD